MKFKLGDKVRIVKNDSNADIGIGDVYTITECCSTPRRYPYKLNKYCNLLWSDDELELVEDEKVFTKKDLKDGMVVEYRNGKRRIVLGDNLLGEDGCGDLKHYNKDLTLDGYENTLTIDKVYKTIAMKISKLFEDDYLTLIWEREHIKEMTVEEIEKELGYKIKVVAKD